MNQLIGFIKMYAECSDWPSWWYIGKWKPFHGWRYITNVLLIWTACLAIPILTIVYIARKSDAWFVKLFPLYIWRSFFLISPLTGKCFTKINYRGTQFDNRFIFYHSYAPGFFIAITNKTGKRN